MHLQNISPKFLLCKTKISLLFFSQKKKSALFEVAEVVPVMTNNYEENILRGVRNSSYSLESSIELLQKDVVQLHAPRYQSMRRVRLNHIIKVPINVLTKNTVATTFTTTSFFFRMWLAAHRKWILSFGHAMILRRLYVCCSPDGKGLTMSPSGLCRSDLCFYENTSHLKKKKKALPRIFVNIEFCLCVTNLKIWH